VTHPGCVVATPYGPPCRHGWCVWQYQASDELLEEDYRAWAQMVSELCRNLPDGDTRRLVTELARNWDGTAAELLDLVGSVLAPPRP
jgi:hypothetical protein